MSNNIKAGKIALPMDVRSNEKVPAFEDMISKGPMAVVLVYADWCGHCDKYKKNVWSPLKSLKNRTVNMASVHYDQLENTSLKNAKIDGYPSLLLVGKDGKPASFNSEYGTTNAMPESNNLNNMKKVITSPKANTVSSLNVSTNNNMNSTSVTPTNINSTNMDSLDLNSMNMNVGNSASMKASNSMNMNVGNSASMKASNSANMNVGNSTSMNLTNSANMDLTNSTSMKNTNLPSMNVANLTSTSPTNLNATNLNTATPPNLITDEVAEEAPTNSPKVRINNQGATPILRGGRLYRKLSGKRKSRKSNKKTRKHKGKN